MSKATFYGVGARTCKTQMRRHRVNAAVKARIERNDAPKFRRSRPVSARRTAAPRASK